MSRDKKIGDRSEVALPASQDVPMELATERAIDAIDFLRREVRRTGLLDCAEILDESFVRCIKAYVCWRLEAGGRHTQSSAGGNPEKLN